MSIRLATQHDAGAISEIYNHYVDTSTCTFQTERESIADRQQWLADHGERFPATVYCVDDAVVAWASLSRWRDRQAYDRTAEVSFYVDKDFHRQGIGGALLDDLIVRAIAIGHHVLMGLVCHEQSASVQLQQNKGFVEVGRLSQVGFKFDRWLDVIYLQRTLG